MFAAAHCLDDTNDPEDEILYGTAGYLQTLLILKRSMILIVEPVIANEHESRPTWEDFTTRIDKIIKQVVVKLIDQTKVSQQDGSQVM